MNVYSCEIRIIATAYVKAESEDEANAKLAALKGTGTELRECDGDLPVSGRRYDDPGLPEVSISPAVSIVGPDEGATADLSEENVPARYEVQTLMVPDWWENCWHEDDELQTFPTREAAVKALDEFLAETGYDATQYRVALTEAK